MQNNKSSYKFYFIFLSVSYGFLFLFILYYTLNYTKTLQAAKISEDYFKSKTLERERLFLSYINRDIVILKSLATNSDLLDYAKNGKHKKACSRAFFKL